MKTVLLALLEQYADWEAAYVSTAIHMLGQGKFEVKTVSLSKETITSIGGIYAVADYTVDSAPKNYDALLLIGGMRWREERAQKMIPLVEHCVKSGKILGGICDAAAFLAPIDGKVREISIATLDEQKFTKILIEKSLFSVGTLRAPCDMKVEQFRRRHGLFLCGRMKISDALNERALYVCKNDSQNFALRIVAGALSRELDVERVKELRAGRKFGFLGSGTVAFYAPVSAKICVSVGDGLRAGEILGYFDKGSRDE